MKRKLSFTTPRFFAGITGILIAAVMLTVVNVGTASAATSGDATIHNWVSVTYTSGTFTPPAVTASVNVTVATLAAQVTITTPPGKSVAAGTFVTYSTAVTSNANGRDTYNLTQTIPATNVSAASGVVFNYGNATVTSISLWGGITVGNAASGQAVISFPGGALATSGLVNGSQIVFAGDTTIYTVSSRTDGSANTSIGVASNEVLGTITLTTNLSVAVNAGTQVGEYKKLAYEFTAGTPTTPGTDGSYLSTLTATSTATTLAGATLAASTTGTTTLVQSPGLTITKRYRILSNPTAVSTPVNPANYNTTGQAKPGEIIEYLLTIQNTNINPASVASGVTITDPVVTPYTAYVTGSTWSGNGSTTISQIDNNATSALVAGYTFASPIVGGNNAVSTAYIVYQVLLQ